MSSEVQDYIAENVKKSSEQLIAAVEKLPEDKVAWSVEGKGRSAANQAAECALMNDECVKLLASRKWPDNYSFDDFGSQVTALANSWSNVKALLQESTARLVEAIRAVPSSELSHIVQMPFGPMTISDVASYPIWNMAYHEGQINFIAALL